MRSLRLIHAGKGRFWEAHWEGDVVEATSGALGTNGRCTEKEFSSDAEAEAWIGTQVAKRRREGFVELTEPGAQTAPIAADAGLLARILAAPADDGLRLVYADQLSAAGDPQGELITVQVTLARAPDAPEAAVLRHRERELLERFRGRWSGKLRGVDFRFERGFAVEARLAMEDLALHAASLWKIAPLLERLHLTAEEWDNANALGRLGALPDTARLKELHVTRSAAPRHVADSPNFRGLEALSLRRTGMSDEEATGLLRAPHLGGLRRVDFRGNQLAGGALAVLCERPLTKLGYAANRLRHTSAGLLKTARALCGLEVLDLSHNALGDLGLEVLADAEPLASVKGLRLGGVKAGLRGVEALCRAPFTRRLVELDLSENALRAEGVTRLLSGAFPALTHLDVSEGLLGDAGLDALLGSPGAERLISLELRKNAFTPAGARRLARASSRLPRLEYLTVSGNPLGAEAVAELKQAFHGVQLVARGVALEED